MKRKWRFEHETCTLCKSIFWQATCLPGMMNIKNIVIKLLLGLFFLSIGTVSFAGETTILTTGEFPPYVSEALKFYGPAPRIVTEAFALEGIKVKYDFMPWARAYENAKHGQCDGTTHWGLNPERKKFFYPSDFLYKETWVFFHLKDYKFDWNTLDDLKGIRIGGTLEYTYTKEFLDAAKSNKINVEFRPNDVDNLKKLLHHRIHIFPLAIDTGQFLIRKYYPDKAHLFVYHPKPLNEIPTHLLLTKKIKRNKRLILLFNQGLNILKEKGKIKEFFDESRRGEYIKTK